MEGATHVPGREYRIDEVVDAGRLIQRGNAPTIAWNSAGNMLPAGLLHTSDPRHDDRDEPVAVILAERECLRNGGPGLVDQILLQRVARA